MGRLKELKQYVITSAAIKKNTLSISGSAPQPYKDPGAPTPSSPTLILLFDAHWFKTIFQVPKTVKHKERSYYVLNNQKEVSRFFLHISRRCRKKYIYFFSGLYKNCGFVDFKIKCIEEIKFPFHCTLAQPLRIIYQIK